MSEMNSNPDSTADPSVDVIRETEKTFYQTQDSAQRQSKPALAGFGLLLFFSSIVLGVYLYASDKQAQGRMILMGDQDQVLSVSTLQYDQVADYLKDHTDIADTGSSTSAQADFRKTIDLSWDWGEQVAGLQTYIEPDGASDIHAGETLQLHFYLRNASNSALDVAGNADYPKMLLKMPFLFLEVTNSASGDSRYYHQGNYRFSCMGKQYDYELMPEDAIQKILRLTPMSEDDFVFSSPYERQKQLFELSPGEYNIRVVYMGLKSGRQIISNTTSIKVLPEEQP